MISYGTGNLCNEFDFVCDDNKITESTCEQRSNNNNAANKSKMSHKDCTPFSVYSPS